MYTVGEKVAHPMHGAGVIEQILPREEGGKERLFYLLRRAAPKKRLPRPAGRGDQRGAPGALRAAAPEKIKSARKAD